MHRVFVYGTLKRGFPYESAMAGQRLLGRCRTREAFPLVIAGRWFSPILIAEPGSGHRVFGELYRVSDETLATLDRMEGTHLPIGYDRIRITVETVAKGARLEAWTYVKERARIDVIHSEMLEDYQLDPRYVPASERRD
jgi:gamma-glutamylaminecyclotransferase